MIFEGKKEKKKEDFYQSQKNKRCTEFD